MGAFMLVDPEHAVRGDADLLDVEFSFLQVAEHLIERGFGDHMLLLLTKRDRNEALVQSCGGPYAFVSRYLPRLLRTRPNLTIGHLSSVPTAPGPNGRVVPCLGNRDLDQVREPLRRLLTQIDPAYLQLLAELDRNTTLRAEETPPYEQPPGAGSGGTGQNRPPAT